MNSDPEQFDQVRRLLALKRYERPHPRYFNQFSQQVLARIEAGDRGEQVTFWQQLSWDAPWLQRLWASFEARPALAATVGFAVCALLLSGVVLSEHIQTSEIALPQGIDTPFNQVMAADAPPASPVVEAEVPINLSSMNGLAISQPQTSLFQEWERTRKQPFQATRVLFSQGN